MITGLIVSVAVLWLAVVGLTLTVLGLARQIGVLHERIAPIGALSVDRGPRVGERAPQIKAPTLQGEELLVGRPRVGAQMLFFLSPSCPVCKKLLPVVRSLAASEPQLEIILASDGVLTEHRSFFEREKLAPFAYVLSAELGMTYRIPRLPYAVLIGAEGQIKAKGLINNREQLEGLLLAAELGVASLQEYRARIQTNGRVAVAAK